MDISTHAPLAGRDGKIFGVAMQEIEFQPTRPLRGATNIHAYLNSTFLFQPTRPLRGATSRGCCRVWPYEISTHAPLAGRDR